MIVYMSEPIDFRTGDGWHDGVLQLHTAMTDALLGQTLFRPERAWTTSGPVSNQDARRIHLFNHSALHRSDLVVGFLPSEQLSVGVPTELAWSIAGGKPTVLVTTSAIAERSIMLRGNPNLLLATSPDQVRDRIAQALAQALADQELSEFLFESGPSRALPYASTGGNELVRHYDGDAAFDLFTTADAVVRPGDYAMIPCGVNVEFPGDVFGWVVSRSSTFKQYGIHVLPGIIDSGFRGEMAVSAYRVPNWIPGVGDEFGRTATPNELTFTIPAGTRLAQLVLLPNVARQFVPQQVELDQLDGGDRGTNGWGSTGRTTSTV